MAALTITASAIVPVTTSANYTPHTSIAAVTITQGQTVYLLSDYTLGLCDTNGSSPAYVLRGVAVTSGLAGQPVVWLSGGDLDFGAILTTGLIYVVGATAGTIHPSTDLTSGWYTNLVGYAISTSRMRLLCLHTGVALA